MTSTASLNSNISEQREVDNNKEAFSFGDKENHEPVDCLIALERALMKRELSLQLTCSSETKEQKGIKENRIEVEKRNSGHNNRKISNTSSPSLSNESRVLRF